MNDPLNCPAGGGRFSPESSVLIERASAALLEARQVMLEVRLALDSLHETMGIAPTDHKRRRQVHAFFGLNGLTATRAQTPPAGAPAPSCPST